MLEFSTLTTPTARKIHICDLCHREIQVGEKYERFAGKNDGDMFDVCHHILCSEIICQYCQYVEENEYDADSVCDWVVESVCAGCKHYDEDREDFTPCTCSTFKCPKVIERFSKRQEPEKERQEDE